jgi:hypothetical protein
MLTPTEAIPNKDDTSIAATTRDAILLFMIFML